MPKFLIKILMPVMSRLTPTCEVVTQKISQSMDEPLSLNDRVHVRLHLMGCDLCARYEKQLLAMRKILGAHVREFDEPSVDVRLSDEARKRIKQEIDRNRPS